MSKPNTITINGIKIPVSEIKGVTFTRGGNDIYIEKPQPNGPAAIGFRSASTKGSGGTQ